MKRGFGIALTGLMLMSSPCAAGPRLFGNAPASPLPAWLEFCERSPADCAVDVTEPDSVPLTSDLLALLSSVNRSVNRTLKPITDENHWGLADLWGYPTDGSGDCEDYQLLKRKRLAEAGLSRRAMRMTVVIDGNGEGHAVLTVRTDRGDFILDNKTDRVLEWFETSYVFVKRESAANVGWEFLAREPDDTMLTAAAR